MYLADDGGILDNQNASGQQFIVGIRKRDVVERRGVDNRIGNLDRHAVRAAQAADDA